jgi:uracil-DNA glycosylase
LHASIGWESFTDSIITALNSRREPLVFMLWGNFARSKKKLITNPAHLVLEAAHPSPLSASRGFFGCGHFIKCNEFLKANGQGEIDWQAL